MALSLRHLPFADAATETLPIGRLLRLSLFQVSVGMALVLLNGTLNRVMIVELDVSASAASAAMVSAPAMRRTQCDMGRARLSMSVVSGAS